MITVLCVSAVFIATALSIILYRRDKKPGYYYDRASIGVTSFIALIISAVAWGIAALVYLCVLNSGGGIVEPYSQTKTDLIALSNVQVTEGRSYFLGSGYIDGTQEIAFVENHGSYSTVEEVDGGSSTHIYQDESKKPYVVDTEYAGDVWWLWPGWHWFGMWNHDYDFHVPEGSIISDYNIDVSK